MNSLDANNPTVAGELPVFCSPLPELPGYAVESLIGRGGMGKVYRATHLGLGRAVAVKLLALDPDERTLSRFREEARSVAKLQHANIAQVFDTGSVDGRPFFAMEYLDGGTLAEKFAGVPQDPRTAAEVVETIARAIQHSHEHGILHRDLKPGNVLLASDGTVKVTDFGLAKEIHPPAGDPPHDSGGGLTRTGEILGTPAYMPPEQASGVFAKIGPAADVYSLGAILYEALTGRPPFQAPDALQTLFMVLSMDPVPPRTLQPKLPKDLETICLKCLEKSPRKRYASAAALADDLHRYHTGEPILARPVGSLERLTKWARRKKAVAALLAVSVLFVLAIVGGAVWLAITNAKVREANDQLEARNGELAQANADLEKSKGETEGMLNYALATMDEYHFDLSNKLANLPQGEKLRIEVLTRARKTLDELYESNPRREIVWVFVRDGYEKLAAALSQVGDTPGAMIAEKRALETAGRLVTAHPEEPSYRAGRGLLLVKQAMSLLRVGRDEESVPFRTEGVALAAELDLAHPDNLDVINLNILATPFVHWEAMNTGQPELMVPLYRRWVELQTRMVRVKPDVPRYRAKLIEYQTGLAKIFANLKQFAEAESVLAETAKTVAELPNDPSSATRFARAGYHEGVGNVAYFRERWTEAIASHQRALREYETLVKDFPDSPNYRSCEVNAWRNIAMCGLYGTDKAHGLASLRTARDLASALARDYPDVVEYKRSLAFIESALKDFSVAPPEKKE